MLQNSGEVRVNVATLPIAEPANAPPVAEIES